MTSIKIKGTFLLLIVLAVFACEEDDPTNKTGDIQFTLSRIAGSTGGRLKEDAASIVVTIKSSSGQLIHERKKLGLIAFGDDYLTEPIALTTGNYHLTEFIVLDSKETAIYATPLEGSPLSHLVSDPLPVVFTIGKDNVTKLAPEVIRIEGNTAADFGYITFGFDIIETIAFNIGVLTYHTGNKNFTMTTSHLKVMSGATVLFDKDLDAITTQVRIRDGFETYEIVVTKSGYSSFAGTFTAAELKNFGSGTPLVVTLLLESISSGLIAHYPFNGNANDETVNELDGVVHGAVLTTDRNGHAQAAYQFDGVDDHIRVPDNDLLDLTEFTISLWAYIAAVQEPENGINDILRKWNGDAQGYPFSISYLNPLADDAFEDKILYARYDGQVCGNTATSHSSLITNETFVHIVMVKDGNKVRTYLNNVLTEEVTDPVTCSVENDADMTIGCRGNMVRFFNGKIDDIRIYDRVLTDLEIGNLGGE